MIKLVKLEKIKILKKTIENWKDSGKYAINEFVVAILIEIEKMIEK